MKRRNHAMKLQVLVDNNTYIDQYYLGEPGVSYYVEIDDRKILFDAGYSDIMIQNAYSLGVDLKGLTHIVLSHGHDDHTKGLKYLFSQFCLPNVRLVAHPGCFVPRWEQERYIGSPFSEEEISRLCLYQPSRAPFYISENCCYLGEIPSLNQFEERPLTGTALVDGKEVSDRVLDDSAIACRTEKGIFIITGCSHSGICNIVEYAKQVLGCDRIAGIIGGFHLFDADERLEKTIEFLKSSSVENMYPCHCVSLKAKAEMMKHMQINEVGVGLSLQF